MILHLRPWEIKTGLEINWESEDSCAQTLWRQIHPDSCVPSCRTSQYPRSHGRPHKSRDPLSLQIKQSDKETRANVPVNFPFSCPSVCRLFIPPVTLISNKNPLLGCETKGQQPPRPPLPLPDFSFISYLTDRAYLTRGWLTSVERQRWTGGGEVPLIVVLSAQRPTADT